MKFSTSLLIIAAAQVGEASAWWDNGHLITARIAYDILTQHPEVLAKVNTALAVLTKDDPKYVQYEGKYPFVECATFADKIKHNGGSWQSGWHFIDQPYLDDPNTTIKDFPKFIGDTYDVTQAISSIKMWMNKEDGYKKTTAYTTIMSHSQTGTNEDEGLSTAIRLLIHYTGDIHQPLHATARVDHLYPAGDRGGNSVYLPAKETAKNLHSVWDSVVYDQTNDFDTPFSDSDWAKIGTIAADFVKTYPADATKAVDLDSKNWAADSFKISQADVYTDVLAGKALTDAYITQGQLDAKTQLVLGGTRLANLMISIYGTSADADEVYTTEEVAKFLQ